MNCIQILPPHSLRRDHSSYDTGRSTRHDLEPEPNITITGPGGAFGIPKAETRLYKTHKRTRTLRVEQIEQTDTTHHTTLSCSTMEPLSEHVPRLSFVETYLIILRSNQL